MKICSLAACLAVAGALFGQDTPVISVRGVFNAFRQDPAPAILSPGGIVWITGLNLSAPDGGTASDSPLPVRLGDVQAFLDTTPLPLFSVSPGKIVAQIPWDAKQGAARIVVGRGSNNSKPVRVTIRDVAPSLRTVGDTGFGTAFSKSSGSAITLSANGLGVPDTPPAAGAPGPSDSPVTMPVKVFIAGTPAPATATLASDRAGEFNVQVTPPAGAKPGDVITLIAGNQSANPATLQSGAAPVVQFLALPDGASEIRQLRSSDLNGSYLLASGARTSDGCYPSVLFDFGRQKTTTIADCLTAAARQALTPAVAALNNNALAALVANSSTVDVFNPANDGPVAAQVSAPPSALTTAGGNFVAVLAGPPSSAQMIDAVTGNVTDFTPSAGGGAIAPAVAPKIDGFVELGSVRLAANSLAYIFGDDADAPKTARIVVADPDGNVTGTKNFPSDWLPLVAPRNPNAQQAPPNGLPAALGARSRVSLTAAGTGLFVLARSADGANQAFIAFGDGEPKIVPMPSGWYVASCTAAIQSVTLTLSTGIVFEASNTNETSFKNPCAAQGFLILDPANQSASVLPLPNNGEIAAGLPGDVNDYVYSTNLDPSRRGSADTLFVLDGATQSLFTLALPAGIAGFAAPAALSDMNSVVALATNRAAGDAGIAVFNLDLQQVTVCAAPDGIAAVIPAGYLPAVRKFVVRGTLTGNTGSQFVIYNLMTCDSVKAPNPDGVVFVGAPPAAAPQPGQGGGNQPGATAVIQGVNAKADTVQAVGYSADRKQLGVMVVKVP